MAIDKLNEKQKRFCEEYLIDLNGTKAYIRAGYSESGAAVSASKLLTNPNISEYLVELRKAQSEKTGVTVGYILNSLKEVAERSMEHVPVMVWEIDEEGNRVKVQATNDEGQGVWQFDGGTANKSLELLGKHIGFFEIDNKQSKPDAPSTVIYIPTNGRDSENAAGLQK